METWWSALPLFDKVLWAIAALFTLLFVVQTILSFLGGDGDSMGDSDAAVDTDDGAGASYFTIRNFITFFTLFGWAGLACVQNGAGPIVSIAVATVAGVLMVALTMWLMAKASQLKHSGTLDMRNAVGKTGTAYLTIPASRGGTGKASLRVQGALRELDAITDDTTPISTGALITVASVIDGRILLVTRKE